MGVRLFVWRSLNIFSHSRHRTIALLRWCGPWNMHSKFRLFVAAGLSLTAVAKLLTVALGGDSYLRAIHPVFGISVKGVLFSVGLLEILGVIAIFWFSNATALGVVCVFFGSNFILYRLFLHTDFAPCPCLGSFGEFLPVGQRTQNAILTLFSVCILLLGFRILYQLKPRSES